MNSKTTPFMQRLQNRIMKEKQKEDELAQKLQEAYKVIGSLLKMNQSNQTVQEYIASMRLKTVSEEHNEEEKTSKRQNRKPYVRARRRQIKNQNIKSDVQENDEDKPKLNLELPVKDLPESKDLKV